MRSILHHRQGRAEIIGGSTNRFENNLLFTSLEKLKTLKQFRMSTIITSKLFQFRILPSILNSLTRPYRICLWFLLHTLDGNILHWGVSITKLWLLSSSCRFASPRLQLVLSIRWFLLINSVQHFQQVLAKLRVP